MTTQKLPMSLKIVAWIFIFWGAVGILEMLVALANFRIFISGSFMALFAGLGLLRLDHSWRKYVLFGMWSSLVVEAGVALWFILRPNDFSIGIPFMFAGQILSRVKFPALIWWLLFCVICSLWQLWVLSNPRIQQLFLEKSLEKFEGPN